MDWKLSNLNSQNKSKIQNSCIMFLVLIPLVWIPLCHSTVSEDELGVVPYELLLEQGAVSFKQGKTENYTAIVYDKSNDQLIVAATNHLLRLKHTTAGLQKLDEDVLTPSEAEVESCQKKVELHPGCHEYRVKWLYNQGDKVYTCGTKAYTPACDVRSIKSIKTKIKEILDSENKAPSYPFAKTAYLVENEKLYVGTSIDVDGYKGSIILSHLTDNHFKSVRTIIPNEGQESALSWMSFPEFIGAFEAGQFVYFVFREEALERPLSSEGYPIVVSRVGRICKSDQGGAGDMAGIIVSFVKATITCPGYDIIQGLDYSAEDRILYTSFTDQKLVGSGICLYELSAIERAFHGKFKYRGSESEPWIDVLPSDTKEGPKVETCFGPRTISDAKHLHLMTNAIAPTCGNPVYQIRKKHFSTVHVSSVTLGETNVQAGMNGYFGDSEGKIWKFIIDGCENAIPIEIWHVGPTNSIINEILVVEEEMHVLTNTRVATIPFRKIVAPPPRRPPHGDKNGPQEDNGPKDDIGSRQSLQEGDEEPGDWNAEADDEAEDYDLELSVHKKVTPPFYWPKQRQRGQQRVVQNHGTKALHPARNNVISMQIAVAFISAFPVKFEN